MPPQSTLAQNKCMEITFGPITAQRALWRSHLQNRRTSQPYVWYKHKSLSFNWKICEVPTKTYMSSVCQSHFPMDKSVLKQCIFQLASIKQPETNVICTWIEFLNTTCNSPSLEEQLPQSLLLTLPTHLTPYTLNCISFNNWGKGVGKLHGRKIWGQSDLSRVTVFINILSSCICN